MAAETMKWVSVGLSISFVLLGIGIVNAHSETPVERGAYLVRGIVACGNCHTPRDQDGKPIADRELAGGVVLNTPVFRAVSPNITPDPETGIGKWADDQIISAIRNGRRPDGTTIGPPMPIGFYRNMSDSDARAIVAYLRTVKPVKNKPEKSAYKIALPAQYGPPVVSVPDVPRDDKAAYGRYLATALGHCMDCHTPRVNGRPDMSRVGAGGREFETPSGGLITSANLTPANEAGIAHWTDAGVKKAITDGVRPDRALVPLMAFEWYKNISSDDLDALLVYLRSLKPAMPSP